MAYVLLSEGCKGRKIVFAKQNGEFFHKPVGKEFSGTLALQTFSNRNYKRITFADVKNVYIGAFKKFIGMTSAVYHQNPVKAYIKGNADYLCHFDFSENDLRTEKKKITYSIQECGLISLSVLTCYNLKDDTGCCYMFPDDSDGRKWVKEIGLTEIEHLNEDGVLEYVEKL